MSVLSKIFSGGGLSKAVDSIADAFDKNFTSQEEKLAFKNELEKMLIADRADARAMYKEDSVLQKIFALTFLVAYVGLIAYLMYLAFFAAESNPPEWSTNLIFTIFGAMSAKVSTITDFLFGGSKDQPSKDTRR